MENAARHKELFEKISSFLEKEQSKVFNFGCNNFKYSQIKCYSGKDGRQELELYGSDRAR